jgi:hypothetical protein
MKAGSTAKSIGGGSKPQPSVTGSPLGRPSSVAPTNTTRTRRTRAGHRSWREIAWVISSTADAVHSKVPLRVFEQSSELVVGAGHPPIIPGVRYPRARVGRSQPVQIVTGTGADRNPSSGIRAVA